VTKAFKLRINALSWIFEALKKNLRWCNSHRITQQLYFFHWPMLNLRSGQQAQPIKRSKEQLVESVLFGRKSRVG
jgi:hypothetical protein